MEGLLQLAAYIRIYSCEREQSSKGWRHERNYCPLSFNGPFPLEN